MTTKQYTISVSFPSGLAEHELEDDIQAATFSVNYTFLSTLDDTLTVHFDGTLSAGDITTLDSVVASYVYDGSDPVLTATVAVLAPKVHDTEFFLVGVTYYGGSFRNPPLQGLYVTSEKTDDVTSYDVLLINADTGDVLLNENLTNNNKHLCKLTTIANVPKKEAVLEVYVRVNGGTDDEFVSVYNLEIVS